MRKREKALALNVELRLGQVLSYWDMAQADASIGLAKGLVHSDP